MSVNVTEDLLEPTVKAILCLGVFVFTFLFCFYFDFIFWLHYMHDIYKWNREQTKRTAQFQKPLDKFVETEQ
jgi:hypothetical protein